MEKRRKGARLSGQRVADPGLDSRPVGLRDPHSFTLPCSLREKEGKEAVSVSKDPVGGLIGSATPPRTRHVGVGMQGINCIPAQIKSTELVF